MDAVALGEKNGNEEDVRKRLKQKSRQGASNLVEQMLKQKSIQRMLLRQSLETGLVISALLVGIMTLVQTLKRFLWGDWEFDLALSVVLIVAFLLYVYWKVGASD